MFGRDISTEEGLAALRRTKRMLSSAFRTSPSFHANDAKTNSDRISTVTQISALVILELKAFAEFSTIPGCARRLLSLKPRLTSRVTISVT